MKREIRGLIVGMLIMGLFMNSASASGIKQMIEVVFDDINIQVNGEKVDADNILYNDVTYVPLRQVVEMFDKEVIWDSETNTANIINRSENKQPVEITKQYSNYPIRIQNEDGEIMGLWGWATFVEKNGDIYFDLSSAYMLYQYKMDNLEYIKYSKDDANILGIDGILSDEENPFQCYLNETEYLDEERFRIKMFILDETGKEIMMYDGRAHEYIEYFNETIIVNVDKYFELMGTEFDFEITKIDTENESILMKR